MGDRFMQKRFFLFSGYIILITLAIGVLNPTRAVAVSTPSCSDLVAPSSPLARTVVLTVGGKALPPQSLEEYCKVTLSAIQASSRQRPLTPPQRFSALQGAAHFIRGSGGGLGPMAAPSSGQIMSLLGDYSATSLTKSNPQAVSALRMVQLLNALIEDQYANPTQRPQSPPKPPAVAPSPTPTPVDIDAYDSQTKKLSDDLDAYITTNRPSPSPGNTPYPWGNPTDLGTAQVQDTTLSFPQQAATDAAAFQLLVHFQPSAPASGPVLETDLTPVVKLPKLLGNKQYTLGKLATTLTIPVKSAAGLKAEFDPSNNLPLTDIFGRSYTPPSLQISGADLFINNTNLSSFQEFHFCPNLQSANLVPGSPIPITASLSCTARVGYVMHFNANSSDGYINIGPGFYVTVLGSATANAYVASLSLNANLDLISMDGRVGAMYGIYSQPNNSVAFLVKPFYNAYMTAGVMTLSVNITPIWLKTYSYSLPPIQLLGKPVGYEDGFSWYGGSLQGGGQAGGP